MKISCCICNKIVEKAKHIVLRNINNYCSRKCFNGEKKVNCIVCNKKIDRTKENRNNFCNYCYHKDYSNNPEVKERLRTYARNQQRKKRGIPLELPLLLGPKGLGHLNSYGYKIITKHGHENSDKTGRLAEHVFVMSQHLKRPLRKGESVHHKNGIKTDNRIENLELWNRSQPAGQRVEDKIAFYKEFLEQYGYKVEKI